MGVGYMLSGTGDEAYRWRNMEYFCWLNLKVTEHLTSELWYMQWILKLRSILVRWHHNDTFLYISCYGYLKQFYCDWFYVGDHVLIPIRIIMKPNIELLCPWQQISSAKTVNGILQLLYTYIKWRMRKKLGMLAVYMTVSSKCKAVNGNCYNTKA